MWLFFFLIFLVSIVSSVQKEASSSGVKTVVKKSVTVSKVTSVKTAVKKKKKVFSLQGQKHETPEEVGSVYNPTQFDSTQCLVCVRQV